jgi:hypothetical protein
MDLTVYELAKKAEQNIQIKSRPKLFGPTEKGASDTISAETMAEVADIVAFAEKKMQADVKKKLKENELINAIFNRMPPKRQKFVLSFNHYPTNRPHPKLAYAKAYIDSDNVKRPNLHLLASQMFAQFPVQTLMVNLYGVEATQELADMVGVPLGEKELTRLIVQDCPSDEVIGEFKRKVRKEKVIEINEMIMDNDSADHKDRIRASEMVAKMDGTLVTKSESTVATVDLVALLERLEAREEQGREKLLTDRDVINVVS